MQSPVIDDQGWVTNKQRGGKDLGNGKETLGERDNVLHLSHCINAVLHGLRMLGPRTVEHALDARNVVFGPLLVRQADDLQIHSASHFSPFIGAIGILGY